MDPSLYRNPFKFIAIPIPRMLEMSLSSSPNARWISFRFGFTLRLLAARLRGHRAVGAARRARLAQQAALPHVAADGGIGRQAAAQGHGQVVVVQLERPLRVGLVLTRDGLDRLRRQGAGAPGVGARAVAQHGDRVGVCADGVEPALQGGKAKAHRQPGGGVPPGFGGQCGEFAVQLARPGRGGQQVADDRKAQARPTVAEWRVGVFAQGVLLMGGEPFAADRGRAYRGRETGASDILCVMSPALAVLARRHAGQGGEEAQQQHILMDLVLLAHYIIPQIFILD